MGYSRFTFLLYLLLFSGLQAQTNRWIVGFKGAPVTIPASDRFLDVRNIDTQTQTLIFDRDMNISEVKQLTGDNDLYFIEPDAAVNALNTPDDSAYNYQWYLKNSGQLGGIIGNDLGAEMAWEQETGKEDVVVGILDSGIDWKHPDLVENIWQNLGEDADGDGVVIIWNGNAWIFDPDDENGIDDDGNGYIDDFIGWDFVNDDNNPMDDHISGHGTHVSGIIGAKGNNGRGISGIAWNVKLMPLKFLDENGMGYTSDAVLALNYALQMGANLSNHSWGGGSFSQAFSLVIDQAAAQNHLLVAAAGNNFGNDNDLAPLYPASYYQENIISVGASTNKDSVAGFSNIGKTSVDLFAPGVGIYSTLPGNHYGYQNGTSMAAPMVSGAAALIISQKGQLNPIKISQYLQKSVSQYASMRDKSAFGGRLNLSALIKAPRFWQKENNFPEKDVTFSPTGRSFHIGNQGQDAWVSAYRPNGAVLWFKKFDNLSFQDIVFSQNKLFVVGKTQQANPNGFLLCLDLNGNVIWMNEYQTSFASGFHILSNNDSTLMVAGYVATLPDTSMVLAEFSQTGATKWMKKLGNMGNNWMPVDLDATSNGHWVVLGRENTDRAFFTVVKTNNLLSGTQNAQGQNSQGQGSQGQGSQGKSTKSTITKSNSKAGQNQSTSQSLVAPLFYTYFFNKSAGQLIPKGLIGNQVNDTYNLTFIAIDSTGEKSVRLVNFDEEQESLSNIRRVVIGSTVHSDIKITGGYNNDLFLLTASADSANSGGESVFLHLDETGIISQRKFLWSDNDPRLSWFASHPLAGVNFSISSGGNNIQVRTNQEGYSNCNTEESLVNLIPASDIWLDTLTNTTQTISWPVNVLSPGSVSVAIGETIICDDSDCKVKTLFSLPYSLVCNGGDLFPENLTIGAKEYQWYLNGNVISSQNEPMISLPQNGDSHFLKLVAGDGGCLDSFVMKLWVEEEMELDQVDSTHCGPVLNLVSPISSPSYVYLWTDSMGNTISDEAKASITQSGTYKLSVTNSCGTQVEADYQITLVSGCVWPGDADANGEVNLVDYLVMGLIHGQTGIARANQSIEFTPKTSSPWSNSFANTHPLAPGVNYQHVDANGDGVIDAHTDGWVVRRNFQRRYSGMNNDSSLLTLSINFDQSTVNWLDTAYFTINLESSDNSLISNLYGVALTLSYDLPISQPIQILPDSSWLNDGVAFDTLTWQNQRKRELHVGMTRLDQNGVDGSGLLFRGGISVIIDDIGMVSALSESEFLNLKITDAFLIKADGTPIQVSGLSSQSGASIFIRPDQTPEKLEHSPQGIWRIGPNPASDYLRIFPPMDKLGDETSVNIKLMNSLGQTVQVFEWRADHSDEMKLPILPDGNYWLMIEDSQIPAILPILIRNN